MTSTERVKKWRKDNPSRALAILRAQQARHGDKIRQRASDWALANPERRKSTKAAYDDRRRLNGATWARHMASNLKCRCAKRGILCTLTPSEILAAVPANLICPALGIPIIFGGKLSKNSPSIDRLIPALGYVAENIRVISNRANVMKQDSVDPEELRRVADYMARNIIARRGLSSLAEGAGK